MNRIDRGSTDAVRFAHHIYIATISSILIAHGVGSYCRTINRCWYS